MKKIALIICLLLVSQASFAYFKEYESSDIKTLERQGYSQDMMRIVETSRVKGQGEERDYVPFYSTKYYSDNPIRKWYQVAKRFVDPGTDNHTFGVGEITFENGMFDATVSPTYSSRMAPNNKYTRLFDDDIRRLETSGKTIKGSRGIERTNVKGSFYQENL